MKKFLLFSFVALAACTCATASNNSALAVGDTESGYTIKNDASTYAAQGNYTLTNKWFRAVGSDFANMPFENNGLFHRGFIVIGNVIYMAGRTANSATADSYLREFDANTGEKIKDLALDTTSRCEKFPCNNVFTDNANNVLISNLTLDLSTVPLKIFQVNLETGALTLRAELTATTTSTKRVDYCSVYGDVTSGNFKVFATVSKGNEIVRWTFANGALASTDICTAQAFYPEAATAFGIASWNSPVNDSILYVKGSYTYLTRYNFATGAVDDSFGNNTKLCSIGLDANGASFFTFNKAHFMIYPYGAATSPNGIQYNLTVNPNGTDYAGYSNLWTFPANGIGTVDDQTWCAQSAYTIGNDTVAHLFIYAPGNGLAAYDLVAKPTGVNTINTNSVKVTVNAGVINLSSNVDKATLYDVAGRVVASVANVNSINVAQQHGAYVLRYVVNGKASVKKVIL